MYLNIVTQNFIMEAYADPLKYFEPDPPNQTKPKVSIVDQTKPKVSIVDQTKPKITLIDQTKPKVTIVDQTKPNLRYI